MQVVKTFAAQRKWYPNQGSPGFDGHWSGSEKVLPVTDKAVNDYIASLGATKTSIIITPSNVESVFYFVTVTHEQG